MEVAVVNLKACNACGVCLKICQSGAIQIEFYTDLGDGKASVDTERCNGCGDCVVSCTRSALSLMPYSSPKQTDL